MRSPDPRDAEPSAPEPPAATTAATERPLVIGHRGASADFAEHTLLAYAEAIEQGADGLECDVRLTRDNHLVCVHDRTVDRTSNGHGVVADLTLDQLRAMDFASWKGNPDQYPSGVLTLAELLELTRHAPRPIRLLIETKHPSRFSGLVEKELVGVLAEHGHLDGHTVSVMSFAHVALRRMRLLAPDVPRVQLFATGHRSGKLSSGVRIAGPSLARLRSDPGLVEQVHRHGGQVYVWTVDAPDDIRYVTELGVDAIITDNPGVALMTLA
jgi:glycerophosphoryl diester phosphodiesterase